MIEVIVIVLALILLPIYLEVLAIFVTQGFFVVFSKQMMAFTKGVEQGAKEVAKEFVEKEKQQAQKETEEAPENATIN